ncbi:MAG: LemA family protein [Candidatus Micrarchaeota archaeon]
MNSKYIILGMLGIIFVLGLIGVLWYTTTYNDFISSDQSVKSQWAQVEVQYQRRYDLIPNLVNSVQAFAKQEQKVYSDIANARSKYAGAKSIDEKAGAASELEGSLARLLVIVENYPQLKSDQTFLALMDELSGTENRISVERKRYNDQVSIWNTKVKTIPSNFVANMNGFKEKQFFQVSTPEVANAPKVNLNIS